MAALGLLRVPLFCLLLTLAVCLKPGVHGGGWTVAHALGHHRRHKKRVKLSEQRAAKAPQKRQNISSIHFLLYPSDVAGDQRKNRIKTILETWGTDIRKMQQSKAMDVRITLMLTEE